LKFTVISFQFTVSEKRNPGTPSENGGSVRRKKRGILRGASRPGLKPRATARGEASTVCRSSSSDPVKKEQPQEGGVKPPLQEEGDGRGAGIKASATWEQAAGLADSPCATTGEGVVAEVRERRGRSRRRGFGGSQDW